MQDPEKEALQRASRNVVLSQLPNFFGRSVQESLPSDHPARTGVFLSSGGKRLRSYNKLNSHYENSEFHKALAATAPNHCLDGWTFFSRALSALISGDPHSTRHLAYYAQLRVSLCLLHCNGIGIFDGINFAVDESGEISDLGPGRTNTAVWRLLYKWSAEVSSGRKFLETIRFRGVSLLDCIGSVWPGTAFMPLVSEVVENWGVDLKNMSKEHDFRNISSYSAHTLNEIESELHLRLSLIRSIWRAIEPDGTDGYPLLDRHMLRNFFRLVEREKAETDAIGRDWEQDYRRLDTKIQELMPKSFFRGSEGESDFLVIELAKAKAPGDVHGMLSRALLLLRLATMTMRSVFHDSRSYEKEQDLNSWFNPTGIDRGFWLMNTPPDDYGSLWNDVSHAVDVLDQYVSRGNCNQHELYTFLGDQFSYLSQAERACMWGMCT